MENESVPVFEEEFVDLQEKISMALTCSKMSFEDMRAAILSATGKRISDEEEMDVLQNLNHEDLIHLVKELESNWGISVELFKKCWIFSVDFLSISKTENVTWVDLRT